MKVLIWCWWAILKDKKILLIKRHKDKKNYPNYWSFPAWTLEENDLSLEFAAKREVKEEVNLDFEITKKFWFYETILGDYRIIWFVFLWNISWNIKIQQSEVSEYWWFNYKETLSLDIAYSYKETLKDLFELGYLE